MIPRIVLILSLLALAGCGSDTPAKPAPAANIASSDAQEAPDSTAEADTGGAAHTAIEPEATEPDWMQSLLTARAGENLALRDICVPRSHDTGTYDLTTCSFGASECNTQTQKLTMLAQLEAGIRIFDVRPRLVDGEYFTHHTTNCELGCSGDSMQNVLDQTRTFLDAHAELVILQVSHFCGTSAQDDTLAAMVTAALGPRLYTQSEGHETPLIARPLSDLIGAEATGKALVLWGGLSDEPEQRAEGRFANSVLPTKGGWSNKQDAAEMVADQLSRYAAFNHDGTSLFEFSWTLTMNAELAAACLYEEDPRTIESMAAEANAVLTANLDALIASGQIAQNKIPNILSVDFADTAVTEQCTRLNAL